MSKNLLSKNIINEFCKEQEHYMLLLLQQIVEINSYSKNIKGINQCFKVIENFSKEFVEFFKPKEGVLILKNSEVAEDFVLFMGHIDTVFPENSSFQKYKENGEIVTGPGVFDMKGGIVIAIFAMKFLKNKMPVVFIINSDEEIGSPNSRDIIYEYSKKCKFAFVFEGAGENGEVVVGRKGKIGLKALSQGEAGHAAFAGKEKKSAILDMAYRIIEFEKINNFEAGISCNVGKIFGGNAPNVIPEECEAYIDIRYSKDDQKKSIEKSIEKIKKSENIPGVQFFLETLSNRPCMDMEKNFSLFLQLKKAMKKYNLQIKEEFRAGVSDANLISFAGAKVLDGFGPKGGNDHSDKEFILKSSLSERLFLTIAGAFELYN